MKKFWRFSPQFGILYMEDPMQLVEEWLGAHNLLKHPLADGARLQGEALRYAVVTFMLRPYDIPTEVVTLLAEEYFAKVYPNAGIN